LVQDSPSVGRRVRDLLLPQRSLIPLLVDSDGFATVPTPDTVLQNGDQVLAVTPPETEDALRAVLLG
jgi:trk system potassium uptake protein TrkA